MNGVVRPVNGSRRVMPPMIENTCNAKVNASPPARSLPKPSGQISAVFMPRATMNPYNITIAIMPTIPISSARLAAMKSLSFMGVSHGEPCPQPRPNNPPQA